MERKRLNVFLIHEKSPCYSDRYLPTDCQSVKKTLSLKGGVPIHHETNLLYRKSDEKSTPMFAQKQKLNTKKHLVFFYDVFATLTPMKKAKTTITAITERVNKLRQKKYARHLCRTKKQTKEPSTQPLYDVKNIVGALRLLLNFPRS